ncbi:protein-arginine deiminase domain-containing protein [Streptomyces sp. HMX112]|uniref:protein-arginine deiminase domain-containing protein n=1 Tax=Streptomyces sp. HMX112 TaxID=3390850 RepID=UPI003A813529
MTTAGALLLPLVPAAPAAASVSATSPPARADLRADVDRDGTVDVSGTSDEAGEDRWTTARGAVFLPNIDDDAGRCRTTAPDGAPLPDPALAACHDASDTEVNGRRDAEDLARLRTVPLPAATRAASDTIRTTGTARITGAGARYARLFVKRPAGWTRLTPATSLTASELAAGVELGVEGTDVIRDRAVWDGTVVVRFTITSGGRVSSDEVTLRAAPLLTHHHLQRARRLLVTQVQGDDPYAREQRRFVQALDAQARRAGIAAPSVKFTKYGDIWAQDFVEPGYLSMTGPGGTPHTLRVMIRSAQPDREAGRELFERMRGRDVGVVQVDGDRNPDDWSLNSMGNLETVPPYAHGGRSFPAGRVIMGERKDTGARPDRAMRTLLASQGLQDPLLLDTSWLHVGHVDEFVQFLPARTPRGWRLAVADPNAGLKLLRDAVAAGHGATRMFSVRSLPDWPAPQETVGQALASPALRADNALAARRIRANLDLLKRETGITDAEIVRVPALYTRGTEARNGEVRLPLLRRLGAPVRVPEGVREHGQQRRLAPPADRAASPSAGGSPSAPAGRSATAVPATSAYIPGAVNGLLLGPDRYLAPRQWGPVIGGKDIFTEAVTGAYRKAGLSVSYIDDYYTYHVGMGEVHCGTNTLRDTSRPWWDAPGRR